MTTATIPLYEYCRDLVVDSTVIPYRYYYKGSFVSGMPTFSPVNPRIYVDIYPQYLLDHPTGYVFYQSEFLGKVSGALSQGNEGVTVTFSYGLIPTTCCLLASSEPDVYVLV